MLFYLEYSYLNFGREISNKADKMKAKDNSHFIN